MKRINKCACASVVVGGGEGCGGDAGGGEGCGGDAGGGEGNGSSTPQSYSPGSSRNVECSNCKHLLDKITVLKATVKMYMHPEQHTVNSAALLHEVYNDMGKLDLE
ncbi:hypothetical protein Tco_0743182 [Tanacetum coccineum]